MTDVKAYQAALQWHIDEGADEALADAPQDRTRVEDSEAKGPEGPKAKAGKHIAGPPVIQSATPLQGTGEACAEAKKLAEGAKNLEELRAAIAAFDGLSIKKTATNMVFCDGNPEAPVMLIGEAPGADEDRQGKPFVGASGQLLDKILACIAVSRASADAEKAIYISNILNWRPPGNRTPTPQEIEISLPFIRRHIELADPKILIFAGGVPAKALLGTTDSISKLRGRFHNYGAGNIPAIATYHPAYLLRTPLQKKAVWADVLMLQDKRREFGLI